MLSEVKAVSILKNKWLVIAVACLCGAILGAFAAGFYYYQYEDLRSRIAPVTRYLDIGIDYGNTTRVWHNSTEALSGETLFAITKRIAKVDVNASGGSIEITAINGVAKKGSCGWFYWIWNTTTNNSWGYVWTAVDKYIIINNGTFMWQYVDWNNFKPPS
jgi:hypothetical protein